jgi:hypothetical protein
MGNHQPGMTDDTPQSLQTDVAGMDAGYPPAKFFRYRHLPLMRSRPQKALR